jgi:hypothetical protein
MERSTAKKKMSLLNRIKTEQRKIIALHMLQIPVPVGAIARDLGLEVKLTLLPPNISGEIRPSSTAIAGFRININRHEKKERQRFTIAHEIGHYLLHSDLIGDGVSDSVMYRSGLSNLQETEANKIAADILMPSGTVERLLSSHGGIKSEVTANILAEALGVSPPAIKIRLGIL